MKKTLIIGFLLFLFFQSVTQGLWNHVIQDQTIVSQEISKAIFRGDIEKFDLLIKEEGLDINTASEKEKWNFLHLALISLVRKPHSAMIEHLIEKGVNVNARDCYKYTPLHYAARSKNSESIKLLLDAGAEIDAVDIDGITPLRHTLLQKPFDLNTTELLLSHGANVNHKTDEGSTVMEYVEAIAHGEDAIILDLFKKYTN